jgi:hypothetical protein
MDNRKPTSIFEITGSVLSHGLCFVDRKQYWERNYRLHLAAHFRQPVLRLGSHRPPLDVFAAPSLLCRFRNHWLDPLGVNKRPVAQAKGDLVQPLRQAVALKKHFCDLGCFAGRLQSC